MYLFEANYFNWVNNSETQRTIEFDEQFFKNEKDCYLYAMGKAYDLIEANETLSSLEFISC